MIGKLTGRVDHRATDHVLVETGGGVGYLVYCSDRTLATLPAPGGMVALYTDLLVREDLLQLIGFPTLVERDWHRLLTSVQGVGAKVALAILGRLGPEALGRALALGDGTALRAVSGVGPKLATRIVTELRDKAPALMAAGGGAPAVAAVGPTGGAAAVPVMGPVAPPADPGPTAEAISALGNLGYALPEAAGAVAAAAVEDPEAPTPVLIRAALKRLAPRA